MVEKGRSRGKTMGFVAVALVFGLLCLALLNGCSSSSVSEEDDAEEVEVEVEATAAVEGTRAMTSDWLSIEVPGNWDEDYSWSVSDDGDLFIDESEITIHPDDYTGYVYVASTKSIGGIYEERLSSIESKYIAGGFQVEEYTIDGAVVRRYEVDSGVEGTEGSYEGFVQFVYSGYEYKSVAVFCLADEYDEHVEEMEEVLDSMTLEDPAEPASVADLAEATLTDDGIPISESLPYKGMDVAFIDVTWLGEHDGEGDTLGGTSSKAGSTPYYWLANNGTGDKVFTAYVRDGEVIAVNRDNSSTNYWMSEDGAYDYPDLNASGEEVDDDDDDDSDEDDSSVHITLEDPLDYDSAEEYADNAYKDFEALGSDDPWNDAIEYWEGNGP